MKKPRGNPQIASEWITYGEAQKIAGLSRKSLERRVRDGEVKKILELREGRKPEPMLNRRDCEAIAKKPRFARAFRQPPADMRAFEQMVDALVDLDIERRGQLLLSVAVYYNLRIPTWP